MKNNKLTFIGDCAINFYNSLKYLFKGDTDIKKVLFQAAFIGYDSLGMSLTITFVAGSVLSLQVAKYFSMTGADAYVGGLISIAMIRELAPVFASLAIGARAGTSIAAEIGNMCVTEQIDAMKTLGVDPVAYLILPRLLAGIFMVPLVTIISGLIGILGGMWVSFVTIKMHPNRYLNSVWLYSDTHDILTSLVKASIFGLLITLICCTHGLNTKGGANEVGQSTTKAAIWSTTAILVFDYFLTWAYYG
jgi:phospholipid/cholesterol/gamma-HCH transport system permease protein